MEFQPPISSKLDRTSTPGNIWDRIIALERRLNFLLEHSATSTADPGSGEGAIIYVGVDASEGSILDIVKQILRFTGTELYAYDNDDLGMTAAIAAASAGDTILLPTCNLVDDYTIPANVTIVGRAIEDCIYTGQIILSDGSCLENLSIIRSEDAVGAIYGIVDSGVITATLLNVTVDVANATGPAYAIYLVNGGTMRVIDSELLAEVGTNGYAAYVTSGTLYQYGGSAIGTTALYPYFM